jgi:hypothetical protein
MADDGSGADITIPSFLLYKPDADAIKEKLRQESLVQGEGGRGEGKRAGGERGGGLAGRMGEELQWISSAFVLWFSRQMVVLLPKLCTLTASTLSSFPYLPPPRSGGDDLVPAHPGRPRRVEPVDVGERLLLRGSQGGVQGGDGRPGPAPVLHSLLPGGEEGREGKKEGREARREAEEWSRAPGDREQVF